MLSIIFVTTLTTLLVLGSVVLTVYKLSYRTCTDRKIHGETDRITGKTTDDILHELSVGSEAVPTTLGVVSYRLDIEPENLYTPKDSDPVVRVTVISTTNKEFNLFGLQMYRSAKTTLMFIKEEIVTTHDFDVTINGNNVQLSPLDPERFETEVGKLLK